MTSSGLAIAVGNPTEVVKVRLQGQGRLPVEQRVYSGAFDCYRKILRNEGLRGLWVGVLPNICRNSVISATEIATYDQSKEIVTQKLGWEATALSTHAIGACAAGFNALMIGSPLDMLTTRLMNPKPGQPLGTLPLIMHLLS